MLITGASRGLGAVAATSFPEHEVIPFTRKEADFLMPCDQWKFLPDVEIVVHCAGGGLGLREPLLTAEAFYQLFRVNLGGADRKSTRLNSSHSRASRMPSSA